MKTIIIIIGLTATQIQERSNMDLAVTDLYDMDARYFRGPISVRYQVKNIVIDLPESELVSLSFDMGILTSADVTPHRRPLTGAETGKLCEQLERAFLHQGFAFRPSEAKEFKIFIEGLKRGHEPAGLTPPWRFGWKLVDSDKVNVVIRPFESTSLEASSSDIRRYTIVLEFANFALGDTIDKKMDAVRKKYFPNRQRVPMSEYPKELQPQ
jgi:hypothetical protein